MTRLTSLLPHDPAVAVAGPRRMMPQRLGDERLVDGHRLTVQGPALLRVGLMIHPADRFAAGGAVRLAGKKVGGLADLVVSFADRLGLLPILTSFPSSAWERAVWEALLPRFPVR